MKHPLRLFLSAAVLAAVSPIFAVSARAADETTAPSEPGAGHPRLEEISKELGLSDEQKAQIGPILQKQASDLRAVQADSSLRKMQRLKKVRSISNEASQQIRALLTPEQQKKYDEMRAEFRKEAKEKLKDRKDRKADKDHAE